MTTQISTDVDFDVKYAADSATPTTPLTTLTADAGSMLALLLKNQLDDRKKNHINVLHWGTPFVGDRTTDNSAALATLITYLKTLTVRPAIYIPAGSYLFLTQPKFDIPCIEIFGDGIGATFLVGDNGVLLNYPTPTIKDISITSQSATSANTGLELRNTWAHVVQNVEVANFAIGIHAVLTDEGETLIPGNSPLGTVDQFGGSGRHSSWPNLDEFVRDSLTTTEHWGSRISVCKFENIHIVGRTAGDVGIKLDNTLADATADYDDFDSIIVTSGSNGIGVFYTGVTINGGHIIADGASIWITGGVHGVKINLPYLDIAQHGMRFDYGAQGIVVNDVNFDVGASGFAIPWRPRTVYAVNDVVQCGDREYIVAAAGGGTSDDNIEDNGVPNSEFVGIGDTLHNALVSGPANPDDLLTQAGPFGMRTTGTLELYVEGVEVIDGKRWLNMMVNLAVAGGSTSATIWFGHLGLANQHLTAVDLDELFSKLLFQNRDPKATDPTVKAAIRCADTSGNQTEQSTNDDIHLSNGYPQGEVITSTNTMTLGDANTVAAAPSVIITYAAGLVGEYRFRVAQPQINEGSSLGGYVRTVGRPRSRWQDGPSGTGSGITDNTVTWDFRTGGPIAAIIAPRRVWEAATDEQRGELELKSISSRFGPAYETNPLSHQFVMIPNPTNSNGDSTTIPD